MVYIQKMNFFRCVCPAVKANNGKQTFLPYLNRLQELKQILETDHEKALAIEF